MGKKPKILMFIPYTPTLIRTRSYNFLRGLMRRGYPVTLVTLWENQAEHQALENWRAEGVNVLACELTRHRKLTNLLTALPSKKPLQAAFCWDPQLMEKAQDEWLAQSKQGETFSAVHIEHLRGSQYALSIQSFIARLEEKGALAFRPSIVWDSVDCISLLFEKAAHSSRSVFSRLVTALELPRTRRYEGWLTNQFDHTLITAEADRAALSDLASAYAANQSDTHHLNTANPPITVLPNGVDLDTFTPNYGERKEATIIMTGKMSYHANVTAAFYLVESVMPMVWERFPDAKVELVGANPPAQIRALVSKYPGKVEVTGTVPSVAAYLREATLAAAPIAYGVGIQNKVLEAMSCATPIVCTPQAVSALKTQTDRDLLVGESPAQFADGIMKLLENRDLQKMIGSSGRSYVENNHSWDRMVSQLEKIYFEP